MIPIEEIAAGFALLAPVYVQLFQIHRTLGRFEVRLDQTHNKTQENEERIRESL